MKNETKSGFTLLELLIVIIIVGVLASIAFVQFGYVIEKARTGEAIMQLDIVRKLQMMHKDMDGAYVGNGLVSDFPDFEYTEPTMEYFENIHLAQNSPSGFVADIYRKGSPSPYHLHIGENGAISCAVNPGGPPDICTRLNIPELGW